LIPRERFLAALRRAPVDRPPVWLMRQAGRYLAGYREVRSQHGFWDVCHTPALSTRVALEPLDKFPLDAAIVFSDILVVPEALGLGVTFGPGEGPRLARPLRSRADFEAWQFDDLAARLAFLPRAVGHLRAAIGDRLGLLGFAGAPWTLFSYMVEGGGSDDFRTARTMLLLDPALAREALGAIADTVTQLLRSQLEAGADAVQLFDTWGGLLDRETYREFALPALKRAIDPLVAAGHPVLVFLRNGQHLLPLLEEIGATGYSVDWRTPLREARAAAPSAVLQGNLDPVHLFAGPDVVRRKTAALLSEIREIGPGIIVNLGHGILPGTPPESVLALCETVRDSG
jgi:uroporphyrinogen decarboxylase